MRQDMDNIINLSKSEEDDDIDMEEMILFNLIHSNQQQT
jgi:hypothetical protein